MHRACRSTLRLRHRGLHVTAWLPRALPALALLLTASRGASAQAGGEPRPTTPRVTAPVQPVLDWPDLSRYRDANAALGAPAPDEPRVVFMGNSITEGWAPLFTSHFPGRPYAGHGIGGAGARAYPRNPATTSSTRSMSAGLT